MGIIFISKKNIYIKPFKYTYEAFLRTLFDGDVIDI